MAWRDRVTVTRGGLILSGIVCLVIGSCLSCGCMIDAGKLAGFSNPKLDMSYDAGRGKFDLEAGTDFQGKAEGHYNPETKQIDATIEVGSTASPVVQAEGERADHLVALRQIEATMLVEMHRLVGENIRAVGDMAKDVGGAVAVVKKAEAKQTFVDSLWSSLAWPIIKVLLWIVIIVILARIVWGYVARILEVKPAGRQAPNEVKPG